MVLDAFGKLSAVVERNGIGEQARLGGERCERAPERTKSARSTIVSCETGGSTSGLSLAELSSIPINPRATDSAS